MAAATLSASAAGTLFDYRLLVLGGGPVKWGSPTLGQGTTVTYALADRSVRFVEARNCPVLAGPEALLERNRIARADLEHELAAAFAAWSSAANITFAATNPADADILIGAQGEPQGRAFTNVEHAPATVSGAGAIVRSTICLNPEQAWKIGFDGDLHRYDLRYTLMHEIGHAIGLDHPGVPAEVMDFRYLETFSVLQPGDRAGVAALYGPPSTETAQAAGGGD